MKSDHRREGDIRATVDKGKGENYRHSGNKLVVGKDSLFFKNTYLLEKSLN